MTCDFETVAPSDPVFRLARAPDPWAWPDWSYATSDGTFGNRWDDLHGFYRVLYASGSRLGAYIETLARFRPDLDVIAGLSEIEGIDEQVATWNSPKRLVRGAANGHGRDRGEFADIGAAASLAVLRSRLANRGVHYELSDIDAAAIRLTAPRGFTQEVSRFVYECRDEDGGSLDGIHYLSRLDDATSNWAIFEPASSSPHLCARSALNWCGLTIPTFFTQSPYSASKSPDLRTLVTVDRL